MLKTYDFIGNVRELRNLAERTSVLYEGRAITREMMEHILCPEEVEISEAFPEKEPKVKKILQKSVGTDERELIEEALKHAGYNKSQAAQALGIDRTTLWRKMKKYGF